MGGSRAREEKMKSREPDLTAGKDSEEGTNDKAPVKPRGVKAVTGE